MRIKLARSAGFCWGVERALDIVLDTANETDEPVFTHGPLIHNPQTVDLLELKNITVSDPASTPRDNGLLVIRAHGISPQVRERLRSSGSTIRDATCPLVAKVHGIIRKHSRLGAHAVIIGEKGHPEVEGHIGYAEAGHTLVTCPGDLEKIPEGIEDVIVVAQTTISMGDWGDVIKTLENRYPKEKMFNTICDATEVRQEEVRRISPDVDLMIIVGGRNSGNTTRLAEVAKEEGTTALLIETEDEIDPDYVRKFKNVGVTAGASTPDWMIRRVVNRLESIPDEEARIFDKLAQGLKMLSRSNALLIVTASMAAIAISALGNFSISAASVSVAALYLFSMHTMNRCASFEADRFNEPNRAQFYEKHRKSLLAASGAAGLLSLGLSFTLSPTATAVMLAGIALGVFYSLRMEPRTLKMGRALEVEWVMDFSASKTLVVTVGWTVSLAVIPALAQPENIGNAWPIAVIFAFGMTLLRSGIIELRDIQGDRIVGKRTLPIIYGKGRTEVLLNAVCAALAVMLVASVVNGWVAPGIGLAMLIPVAIAALGVWLYKQKIIGHSGLTEAAVDLQFICAGVVALVML